ncbi:cytosolic pyruvate kinase [Dunaliella salina]|uniref:Pyruvate kinase n=1 Tax=Dunaliella salina TaxID=3046 RepID=A0ABQ7FZB0_DUNSA|nr:cytosolic pyruvate kinase [Dunaliella salina]|eukprot:KAF5827684.1 cytosolic pyruvate kinase [Dunaliella salina]
MRKGLKVRANFFEKDLKLSAVMENAGETTSWTGSKIMATIGPSIHDTDILAKLLEAGMAAGRVDLTWGPLEFHRNSLQHLSEAMRRTRRLCSTVIDTMGRELMVRGQWQVDNQGYPWVLGRKDVHAGEVMTLTTREDAVADHNLLPIMYPKFAQMCQRGDIIHIARYLVSGAESSSLYLEVSDVQDKEVVCMARNTATLEGLLCVFHCERSATANLVSNIQNELPLLSDWDKECIQTLGSEYEIDFINLSYTRNAEDVREARRYLQSVGMHTTKILAKVETRQALLNFQGILSEADGIIISRGNLGLDCEPEKMAMVQKTVIQSCNLVGKPVILTRVVDTMVSTPRPTRAEATDVANAVLDGVDGIMLGAETLRVCSQHKHACGTATTTSGSLVVRGTPYLSKLESIASSAVRAADKVNASLIVVYTHTGQTAELVAKYRPPMPILTLVVPHLTSNKLKWKLEGRSYTRQCMVNRGLLPFLATPAAGETLLEDAVRHAAHLRLVKPNDHVVVVQRIQDDFCIKIVSVSKQGNGIQRDRAPSSVAKSNSLQHIPDSMKAV